MLGLCCAEIEGTDALDAAALGCAEVAKVSAGDPEFEGVGFKYFKSVSEERTGVYGCYIILILILIRLMHQSRATLGPTENISYVVMLLFL